MAAQDLGSVILSAALFLAGVFTLYRANRRTRERHIYLDAPQVLYFRFDLRSMLAARADARSVLKGDDPRP